MVKTPILDLSVACNIKGNSMDTYVSVMHRLLQILIVLGIGVSISTTAHAQAIDEISIVQQLRELKELCDDGLVSPDVCKEKQRVILGLESKTKKTDVDSSTAAILEMVPEPSGTDYHHPLGFQITLPADWLVFEAKVTSDDLEKFKERLSNDEVSQNVLRYLEFQQKSGAVGILQNGKASIKIQKNRVALPANNLVSQQFCEGMTSRLSSSSSGPRTMYECKFGKIGEFPAFYIDHDSIQKGMRTIQYWIENTDGDTYMFLLDCDNANLEARRTEFKSILASIRWE